MSGACYYGGDHVWTDAQMGTQTGIMCVNCKMFIPK